MLLANGERESANDGSGERVIESGRAAAYSAGAPRSGGETTATEAGALLLLPLMPRFYMHLWDGPHLVEDEEGIDLSDSNAAVLMAKRALGEMLCGDVVADRDSTPRRIVVADSNGRAVADVSAPSIAIRDSGAPAAAPAIPSPYEREVSR